MSPLIQFRCWQCRRMYRIAENRIGVRMTCGGCTRTIRVPKRSGGNCRVRTLGDWLIEIVVCGGSGAFLGACSGVSILTSGDRQA